MGNALRKIDLDNLSIDGGAVKSPEPIPQITLANGQRHNDPNAHDAKVVGKLVAKRRLAPFYEGKFDEPRDSASGRLSRVSSRNRRGEAGAKVSAATATTSKASSKYKSSSTTVDKKWLTNSLLECPICLMWYPKNINVTKCCRKNICTQCFVNMKRPRQSHALIACPFCRSSNLTVVYKPPEVIMGKASKYYRSGVTCESIRPARIIVQPQRPMYYRYATGPGGATQPAFAVPATAQNGRTTYAFYQQSRTAPYGGPYYPSRYASGMAPGGYQRVTARAPAPSVTRGNQSTQPTDEAVLRRVLALSALEY